MRRTTRLAVAAAALAAVAATGTTSASAAGTSPSPTGVTSGTEKSPGKPDAALAAAAAKLGVTTDRLMEALTSAKKSLAGSSSVSQDQFVAAVAAGLGLPVGVVNDALTPVLLKPGRDDGGKPAKKKDGEDQSTSPLLSDTAAAAFAATLGVDQAKAKAALANLVKIGSKPRGIDPSSKDFAGVASSLGVTVDQLKDALGTLKQSLEHA
jgi:hypothetical protein